MIDDLRFLWCAKSKWRSAISMCGIKQTTSDLMGTQPLLSMAISGTQIGGTYNICIYIYMHIYVYIYIYIYILGLFFTAKFQGISPTNLARNVVLTYQPMNLDPERSPIDIGMFGPGLQESDLSMVLGHKPGTSWSPGSSWSISMDVHPMSIDHLVGGFNPSEKY